MILFFHLISLFSLVLDQSESARILAEFPVPSISHQVVFRPLTEELAKRGHEVTVITTDPAFPKGGAPVNLTKIDVHDISYDLWKKIFIEPATGNMDDVVLTLKLIYDAIAAIADAQFQDENVQKILRDKNRKFDLLLAKAIVRPVLVFSHIYKKPVIQISSFGGALDNYQNIGAPVHPILYPAITRQRLNNLSVIEKVTEVYNDYQITRVYRNLEEIENKILRKYFGDDVPPVSELNNNVDMLFLNINPIFEGIRPVPPSVVYMGGLHQKPNKELPKVSS